jgi:di/tricarboxylate transporter
MNADIITVLVILLVTVILLVVEVFRIDLIAMLCMLALSWSGILTPPETLSGFSSNAVIAMIAVMIMGSGLARTGIMIAFSGFILKLAGDSERRIVGLVSFFVGLLSSFMQNVGAAALSFPAMINISKRRQIPASRLIMPLGFAIILGGTLTMVASSPLILLNDLLKNAGLKPYGLFGVTPVGLVLLVSGVLYFTIFHRWVLSGSSSGRQSESAQKKLIDTWHLPRHIRRYRIPARSGMIGLTPEKSGIWTAYGLHILAVSKDKSVQYSPWRHTRFEAGQELALLGDPESIRRFASYFKLTAGNSLDRFDSLDDPSHAGFVEILIPSHSNLIGRSIRQMGFRKQYAVEPLLFFSGENQIKGDFSDHKIRAGDTLVIYGLWTHILRLKESSDFVVITPFEVEKRDTGKTWIGLFCFLGAIVLSMLGFPLSISLFTGAVAMVLTRVIPVEEAYRAIEWKVVFLIAGLIPLGLAMQKTGTAEFLASQMMALVKGGHPLFLILVVAMMATLFSLVMSNVASTVVLVPLVIKMAQISGLNPRPLVLLVAVCAANSFILPTHQVNAMLMTPGGYHNRDYFRAGGGMTLLFIVVVITVFYLFYL